MESRHGGSWPTHDRVHAACEPSSESSCRPPFRKTSVATDCWSAFSRCSAAGPSTGVSNRVLFVLAAASTAASGGDARFASSGGARGVIATQPLKFEKERLSLPPSKKTFTSSGTSKTTPSKMMVDIDATQQTNRPRKKEPSGRRSSSDWIPIPKAKKILSVPKQSHRYVFQNDKIPLLPETSPPPRAFSPQSPPRSSAI